MPWGSTSSKFILDTLKALADHYKFSIEVPLGNS
ncbi:MAG: hypothetical protein O7C55_02450 [Rickettsia endosymbiont of Ixodes persulcatus]|nr:hypothetical protein [Rickettsia endosymbiont of Ixodes persulcatus]